jgi:hypothetical protein
MFSEIYKHITLHGESVDDPVISSITKQNADALNRRLRTLWKIDNIRFVPTQTGEMNVVFQGKSYRSAEKFFILVNDSTIVTHIISKEHHKCLTQYRFSVKVYLKDELFASNNGTRTPATLLDVAIPETDPMTWLVYVILRLLDVPIV